MRQTLGDARLGTVDAVGQTLAIGPVVSISFAAYIVAGEAGGALALTILVAFAGSLALGWVFTRFARRYAGVGAIYEYLGAMTGPVRAVAVAGSYFLIGLVNATSIALMSLLTQQLVITELGFDPGWWTGGVVGLVIVGFLLYRGIRWSTRALLALTAVSAVPLLVLVGDSLLTADHTFAAFDPGEGNVPNGLLYAVLLFVGFEAVTCLGEEAGRPRTTIPRALVAGIVVCGIFYVITSYALTVAFGVDQVESQWGADPFAVIALADANVGEPLGSLILLGVILDIIAFLLATGNLSARGMFAFSRDGLLPARLSAVSRHGTPVGGIVLFLVANAVLLGITAFYPDDRFEPLEAAFSASPFVILTVYILVCLAGYLILREDRAPAWSYLVLLAGLAVPALGLYGSFDPFPEGRRLAGLIIATLTIAVAVAYAVWLGRARRDRLEHAEGLRAQPLSP